MLAPEGPDQLETMDRRVVDKLRGAVPHLIAVYRFGSTARGEGRADSDVDLAVLAAARLDPVSRFELQEGIARELGRDVDLVDLRAASTVMRMQILSTSKVLVVFDRSSKESFEMYAYSDYARLNEERAPILERIRREGTIYGG